VRREERERDAADDACRPTAVADAHRQGGHDDVGRPDVQADPAARTIEPTGWCARLTRSVLAQLNQTPRAADGPHLSRAFVTANKPT
jgi:hypothetical protein